VNDFAANAIPPKKGGRRAAGLRTRLMGLLALVSVAPTLLLGFIAIRSARSNVQDEVIRGHLALIRAIGHQLNARLQDTRRALVVTASAWAAQREIAKGATTPQVARLLRRLRSEFPLLRAASALGRDGRRMTGEALPKHIEFRRHLANSYGGYVSDVILREDGSRQVLMVVQVRDRRGELFGFIAALVDLGFVRERLREARIGRSAALLVVDGRGRAVASSGRLPKLVGKKNGGRQARANPVIDRMLATHAEGHLEWQDDANRRWLSVYRNIAGMSEFRAVRWGVILQEPTSDAYALAERNARNTLLISTLVLLVALATGAWMASRLTRPLARLVRQTKRVAAGDLDISLDRADTIKRDELGQLAESFAVMVRELRSDRERLYALTEFRENLVLSLPVGVISIDRDQHILTLNPAQEDLSEIRALDAVNRPLHEVFDPERDEAGIFPRLERVLSAGGTVDLELQKGESLPFTARRPLRYRVRITPLRKRSGDVDGAVILQEDLSEGARLQQQLMRSEKLSSVGVLAAGVAHEINNPLTTILGYAKLLLEGRGEDDPDRSALDLVAAEALRVQQIVRSLLDFSRQESGDKKPVSINELVERTVTLVAPNLKKRRVVVKKELCKDLPFVLVDARRIEQVFVNLLTNASHAMPNGGTMTVRTGSIPSIAPPRAYAEFEDTGVGMEKDVMSRIFDPFFTTKEPGKGTGLGLSVSHGIISDHGGKIDVESEPGKGTTFRVSLPCQDV
jgi:signal transduction histidine kinase/HAMP domain-containing protein